MAQAGRVISAGATASASLVKELAAAVELVRREIHNPGALREVGVDVLGAIDGALAQATALKLKGEPAQIAHEAELGGLTADVIGQVARLAAAGELAISAETTLLQHQRGGSQVEPSAELEQAASDYRLAEVDASAVAAALRERLGELAARVAETLRAFHAALAGRGGGQ